MPKFEVSEWHGKYSSGQIGKEVLGGRVWGPYKYAPLENLWVSPLGVVPKMNKGEHRLIHYLSYPEGESVHAFSQELHNVRCTSFYEEVDVELGRSLQDATLVSVSYSPNPSIRRCPFGLLFSRLFIDGALSMGCSVS